jgi:glycosyltransferase involved in cell wall biosynthesis
MNDLRVASHITNKASGGPLRLERPVRITEQLWPEGTVPVVSIACPTYNHKGFIRQCLDGFLIQETTFPVEIVVHDDASTDGTTEVVREYESKYPKLIKAIFQAENQCSKGGRVTRFITPFLTGSYVAVCEGDDYWTDVSKLQIQVSFLEENPDFVISGHDAYIIDEVGNRLSDSQLPDRHKRNYSAEDLLFGRAKILTMSRVYRNILPRVEIPERTHIKNNDTFTASLLGQFGGSKYHPEIAPACYRRHPGGIWSMERGWVKDNDLINCNFWIYQYYQRVGKFDVAQVWHYRWSKRAISRMNSEFIVDEAFRRVSIESRLWRFVFSLFWLGLKNKTKRFLRLIRVRSFW